jgi:outer membrane lipoprotein-sorting protein
MHRSHSRLLLFACLLAVTLPLSGCLFRTRVIDRQLSNAPLKTATQQELIDYVNTQAGRIQSMQATVDIDSTAGNPTTGRVTDYKEIRGYILARKPDMLRMKGLMPVVRNTAFDMVSDGKEFKLWIPPRNKFVIGVDNDDNYQPDKRMENMRPEYIYHALLLAAIGQDEIAVLENGYETVLDSKRHRVDQPDYELAVIRKGPQGWFLSRRVQFSRTDLVPHRLRIYDQQGNVATDAHYQKYKDFTGISFPTIIEIERPREGYDITLNILKLELNRPLGDDQFALEQPPGAEVVRLGAKSGAAPPSSAHRVAGARDDSAK